MGSCCVAWESHGEDDRIRKSREECIASGMAGEGREGKYNRDLEREKAWGRMGEGR